MGPIGISLSEIELERIFCAIELQSQTDQVGTIDFAAFSSFMHDSKVCVLRAVSLLAAHEQSPSACSPWSTGRCGFLHTCRRAIIPAIQSGSS